MIVMFLLGGLALCMILMSPFMWHVFFLFDTYKIPLRYCMNSDSQIVTQVAIEMYL
jgi:hypothetical protein